MLLKLMVVLCAWLPCSSLHDASTLRLASVLDVLAPGEQQTVAGVANLILQVMESPITRVRCLTLSAVTEEAGRPTGLPTGLARDEKRFAVGRGDCKAGHITSCKLKRAFPCHFTGTNSVSAAANWSARAI